MCQVLVKKALPHLSPQLVSTSSCSVMILVSNHCHSFFLLFFILAPGAYVNANEFTFSLLSSPQVKVHWNIEQPPANFLLTLVEDHPNATSIAVQPVTTNGRQSGDVTFNNLHLEPGTYRVAAGVDSNQAFFGSSSEKALPSSTSLSGSIVTTSRGSETPTSSTTASPQATSSTTTGEATTTTAVTTTSEETPSGGNDGSGPNTIGGNGSGASSESAASQPGSSSGTAATTTHNPNASPSSVPATQKSPFETNAHVPSTDPAPSSSPSPVAASSNDSSSKVGIIVGAVLGAIAFLGLLACTGVVLLKRRNRKRAEQLLIRDMLAAPPYSQRSSTMTRIVDDEVLEKQLLEWKYGPGGLAEEAGVQRRLQEWKYGGVSRCETPCSSV